MTPDGHSWKPRRVVTLESESRWSLYLWCRSRARHVVVMKGRLKLRCSLQWFRESVRETRVGWKWTAHDLMSKKRIQEDGERLFLMVVNKLISDTVIDLISNLHLCAAHWMLKKGKASGRPIWDLPYVSEIPLNGGFGTLLSMPLFK